MAVEWRRLASEARSTVIGVRAASSRAVVLRYAAAAANAAAGVAWCGEEKSFGILYFLTLGGAPKLENCKTCACGLRRSGHEFRRRGPRRRAAATRAAAAAPTRGPLRRRRGRYGSRREPLSAGRAEAERMRHPCAGRLVERVRASLADGSVAAARGAWRARGSRRGSRPLRASSCAMAGAGFAFLKLSLCVKYF